MTSLQIQILKRLPVAPALGVKIETLATALQVSERDIKEALRIMFDGGAVELGSRAEGRSRRWRLRRQP